jgi:hypothetical protein
MTMTTFFFTTTDKDGVIVGDIGYDYPDLIAAIAQAKATLAEMASDNIPLQASDVLSVSIENVRRDTVATMRLVFQIEFPTSAV